MLTATEVAPCHFHKTCASPGCAQGASRRAPCCGFRSLRAQLSPALNSSRGPTGIYYPIPNLTGSEAPSKFYLKSGPGNSVRGSEVPPICPVGEGFGSRVWWS